MRTAPHLSVSEDWPVRTTAVALVALVILGLVPSLAGTAGADSVSVQISPAIAGNTAVRASQSVAVSGNAPTGETIQAAALVGTREDGEQLRQAIPQTVLNRGPGQGSYLRNEGGAVDGQLLLNCQFGPPNTGCPSPHGDVRTVHLEVTVADQTADSNEVRVDYERPFIRGYELVAPDRIVVRFSEPVHHTQGDSPEDWQVSEPNRTIMRVLEATDDDCVYEPGEDATAGPTGCTRTLVVFPSLDEDATPFVTPRIRSTLPLSEAGQYQDFASNNARLASHGAMSNAVDRIRPPLPEIAEVEGTAPDSHNRVSGETTSPSVTVGNLRAGHTVHFDIVRDGGAADRVLSEPAAGQTHTAELPDLGTADEYGIHVIVEDPAGNLSTDGHLHSARDDASPSKVCYAVGRLCDLPLLPGPTITQPAGEHYTRDMSQTIAGSVQPAMADIEVEVTDLTTGQSIASTSTREDGTWVVRVDLDVERRYEFEVATRDGERTVTARVPDIILDQTPPIVQVLQPGPDPSQLITRLSPDLRSRFAEGDTVNIAWLGSDLAPLDLVNPEHGSHVDIDVAFDDGVTRAAARDVPYTPLFQSHGYIVQAADVSGPEREATFDVTVHDLAGNRSTSTSLPVVIDGTILGYQALFVQNQPNAVIEARFSTPVQGTTTPLDWRVDGQAPQAATMQTQGGQSVVRLVASQSIPDPNATPEVQFVPAPANPDRLRGADGREISTSVRIARDAIPPVLSIVLPDPGPTSAQSVAVTGQTDVTSRPNHVLAFRDGRVVAQTTAAQDGHFTLNVPLAPDRLNRVGVRAVDPAGNLSPERVFEVVQDSTAPVVVIQNPVEDAGVPRSLPLRWITLDEHPDVVDIEYRVSGGAWQALVTGLPDEGRHRWDIPASIPDDAVLGLRITATDQVGHRGQPTTVSGLSLRPSLLAACEAVEPAPFADRRAVPEVHQFAVDCLYELGIAKGSRRSGQLWFDPQADISRGQFSGFLSRTLDHANADLPPETSRFNDVPEGHTFDVDIHRLAAAEVVLGYDERTFGPRDPIKRDQTASLLLRALAYFRDEQLQAASDGYFSDTAPSAHRRNIDAAYEQGLVVGRTAPSPGNPGFYDPGAWTTRAQMATVLVRALEQFDR